MLDQESPLVLHTEHGGIVTLELNRPHQFNALSHELLQALAQHIEAIEHNPQARVVILQAKGNAFCAGHDLKQMRAKPSLTYYQQLFTQCTQVMQGLQRLPIPVIAKVHGLATAAGCQLIASCDLVIASTQAQFAVSGINVGLFCSSPAVALSRNLSPKRAFDLLVTGRFIDAQTAEQWGLINHVVPAHQLDQAVQDKVDLLLAKNATAIRYGKRLFYEQLEMPQAQAYAHAVQVMAHNMMEEDALEGLSAFIEKRPAHWQSSVHLKET
ncbi:MAG TPA: enoyl-CoA hydratase [Paenalcaligenes hominis]|uniref:Enoyl-CoA hydratase domain-containing protein 3, mitochondrial n=1 Tax=Paenalcaligenes hominis TaxID=643674 RepID=A0A9D2VH73_9BURK|nr:enoyl-CoA hydratase [Paenalcaligenes hominis]